MTKRNFIEIDEDKCNGCGDCVVACAEGALEIVDGKAKVVRESFCDGLGACIGHCPQDALKIVQKIPQKQWPIQLHLVNPAAPYFKGANLLIAASCTAFSMGDFHKEFIKGNKIVIACPKLDRTEGYVEKLAEIIKQGEIKSITIARMEVPCCSGLTRLVLEAIKLSGKKVPFLEQVISLQGNIL
ncbi:ATP-binding protein [Candidatus Margulisiibacteriota bacterium]